MAGGTNGPATRHGRDAAQGSRLAARPTGLMGAIEPSNRGVKETTTVNTGVASMKITGYGSHSFQYPIDSGSSTITIYGYYDASYTGSNLPRISIRDGAAGRRRRPGRHDDGRIRNVAATQRLTYCDGQGDDHGHSDGAQRRSGGG